MKRHFETGAVRDGDSNKPNYLSYLHPTVLRRYGVHMKKAEKKYGEANWQKGFPKMVYLQSLMRHFVTLWAEEVGTEKKTEQDHASALLFNIVGFIYEEERTKDVHAKTKN